MRTKSRKKTSIIWSTPPEKFSEIVKKSKTITEICRILNFSTTGTCFELIKKRILIDGIDASHIPLGLASRRGRKFEGKKIPLGEILVVGSTYNRGHLKRRLIAEGLLENECSICGLNPEWNGFSLVMILDHKNGIHNDNRLENLRLLCPNCNSQQSTFSGRNKKQHGLFV